MLVVSGQNASCNGVRWPKHFLHWGRWLERSLHWQLLRRTPLTLKVGDKKALTWWSVTRTFLMLAARTPLPLAVGGQNAPHLGSRWPEGPSCWRSVATTPPRVGGQWPKRPLALAVGGQKAPCVGGQKAPRVE